MAEFSCPGCGAPVFPPPGASSALCPHCGTPAAMVLRPAAPRQPAQSHGTLLWVVMGIGALIAVALGLRFLTGGGEPRAVMASGGSRSLSSLAGPVRARPVIRSGGRRILIGLSLADCNGKRIRSIHLAGGRRPPAPRVAILNAAGTVVYTCKLAYG
jgi:predicted RNA-binding Zn-ribbon protein involved in translation (DUF1610 family)